eukprot:gene4914-6877_t
MSSINYRILKHLKLIDNRMCADCSAPLVEQYNCYACLRYLVWICTSCAGMHIFLLENEYKLVKSAQDTSWTDEDITKMENAKSNVVMNRIYERYLPENWEKLSPDASDQERLLWIKAKYISRFFTLPHNNSTFLSDITPRANNGQKSSQSKPIEINKNNKTLPIRIVDYFLSISLGKSKQQITDLIDASAEDILFEPLISQSFPERHSDTPIPEFVGQIVFPSGLSLSSVSKQPFSYSFVLTDIDRVKIYGHTLVIYELLDPEQLKHALKMKKSTVVTDSELMEIKIFKSNQVIYAPRALTIISHYGFFNLFSRFLEQIYHVSLSSSPLPIERYFTNFMKELPLPPQGRTEVFFALPESLMRITRPPKNHLPMVDFSYRPLFTLLSVDNIIAVFCCLCAEMTICICSENIALLTPIQEALLSFLFPFIWQGCYVPILPANMMEILDAPVPFLVGIHPDYLKNRPKPATVVLVDIDNDVIDVGQDDTYFEPRVIPTLPAKALMKLKKKLMEFGGHIHRDKEEMNKIHQAGRPFPNNEHLIPIKHYISEQGVISSSQQRTLSSTNIYQAYSKLGIIKPSANPKSSFSDNNTNAVNNINTANNNKAVNNNGNNNGVGTTSSSSLDRVPYRHPAACSVTLNATSTTKGLSILDPVNNCYHNNDGFNAHEIREAFLRLFVASLSSYQDFIFNGGKRVSSLPLTSDSRNNALPVDDLNHNNNGSNRLSVMNPVAGGSDKDNTVTLFNMNLFLEKQTEAFIKQFAASQMFSNFINERMEFPNQPEIQFFDENIIAKENRSKYSFAKKTTPFLSDESDFLFESFTVPGPSNAGISNNSKFTYLLFPHLNMNSDVAGHTREALILIKQPELRRKQGIKISDQLQLSKKKPLTPTPSSMLTNTTSDTITESHDDNHDKNNPNYKLLTSYRHHCLYLWYLNHTSLLYRSKFWSLINHVSYMHIALYEDEILYLYESLGFVDYYQQPQGSLIYNNNNDNNNNNNNKYSNPKKIQFNKLYGLVSQSEIIQKLSKLNSVSNPSMVTIQAIKDEINSYHLIEQNFNNNKGTGSNVVKKSSASSTRINAAMERDQAERNDLYLILKSTQKSKPNNNNNNNNSLLMNNNIETIFQSFNIQQLGKRKQLLTSTLLWNVCNDYYADLSAQVVLALKAHHINYNNINSNNSNNYNNFDENNSNILYTSPLLALSDKEWIESKQRRRVARAYPWIVRFEVSL